MNNSNHNLISCLMIFYTVFNADLVLKILNSKTYIQKGMQTALLGVL